MASLIETYFKSSTNLDKVGREKFKRMEKIFLSARYMLARWWVSARFFSCGKVANFEHVLGLTSRNIK